METTTMTIERVKAKLSCNHTVDVPAGQPVGAEVDCEKCKDRLGGVTRTRRIKRLLGPAATQPEPVAAQEAEAASDRVAELVEQARRAPEYDAEVIALHGGAVQAPAPEADEDGDYDRELAKAEWNAVKAWRANGSKGEQPPTPNLDAMNAAHEAGKPRKKAKKSKGTSRTKSVLTPEVKKARESGKRGAGTKLTDEELVAYIRRQREAYPAESLTTLHEYSWWVDGNAHGLKRWTAAWDQVTAEMEEATKD
jgi:hypothetical protein